MPQVSLSQAIPHCRGPSRFKKRPSLSDSTYLTCTETEQLVMRLLAKDPEQRPGMRKVSCGYCRELNGLEAVTATSTVVLTAVDVLNKEVDEVAGKKGRKARAGGKPAKSRRWDCYSHSCFPSGTWLGTNEIIPMLLFGEDVRCP